MAALVINFHKGQRMDITAQMKDADAVLKVFQEYSVRFDKKYTTITNDGPSTITFKGVKSSKTQDILADLLCDLTNKSRNDEIGNVYVKFVSMRPKIVAPEQDDTL